MFYSTLFYGSTAQFSKKSQAGFLFQFKVPKMEEYCMYFPFSELRKWSKKTAETRRRNCAVLPYTELQLKSLKKILIA